MLIYNKLMRIFCFYFVFIAHQDNLLCVVGNACKYSQRSRVDGSDSGITVTVHCVLVGGRKLVEFSVQDASSFRFTPVELKALYNRPVIFKREAVGGMGTGMCCLAARVQALGGGCGARLRADGAAGTVVWFRVPLVEGCEGAAGEEGGGSEDEGSSALTTSRLPPALQVNPLTAVADSAAFLAKKFDSVSKLMRRRSSGLTGGAEGGEGEVPVRVSRRQLEKAVEEVEGDGKESGFDGGVVVIPGSNGKNEGHERGQVVDKDEAEDKDVETGAAEMDRISAPALAPVPLATPRSLLVTTSMPVTAPVPVLMPAPTLAPVAVPALQLMTFDPLPSPRSRPGISLTRIPTPAYSAPHSPRSNPHLLQGRTILVVDDAPTIVKMVVRMLTAAGATVDFAKDGREGLEVFKAAQPAFDMVVTDIQVLADRHRHASSHKRMHTHLTT